MYKSILSSFQILCVCLSLVSLQAPVAHAGTAFVINVKDFDATGDGETDDTVAIQNAADAASRGTIALNPGAVYTAASPLLYFPPGHYRISDEIQLGAYVNVGSDSKAIIEQTDPSKRIFVFAGAYQIEVSGLRFIGGKNQIYYSNNNLDISTLHIDNCEFTLSSDYAIYTIGTGEGIDTHLSCLLTISRSRFVYPNKVLHNVCASAVIRDCWVQIGSQNFDDNSAAFYNAGASLTLDNMFGVPVFGKDWNSQVRWIDATNNGRVIVDRSRFGGEDAGIPIIYYSGKPQTAFPFMGGHVSIRNSQLCAGATNRPDSGVVILDGGVPALLVIQDNTWLINAPYIRTHADFNLQEFFIAYPQKDRFKLQIGPNATWPATTTIPDELMPFLNSQAEVIYTPGDTWKLEGATDWTNRPNFAGLGTIQSTGQPDPNAVWRFMRYDDVATGPLFNNPSELINVSEDDKGQYRWRDPSPAYLPTAPWLSDTWLHLRFDTYGARYAGAVVWESPVSGTFQIDATLSYTGVGTVSFGVFYHDISAGAFYQIQKDILKPAASFGWTPLTSAVVRATVSLNAGDRLVFLQRAYSPSDGYEYLYSTGYPNYAFRRCEHRNLSVTFLSLDLTNTIPQVFCSWRRKDLHWRADVEDSLKTVNGGTSVVRDRRLPGTRPAMFNYYVSTNPFMGHATVNATGLSEGETLEVAKRGFDFFGDYGCGCSDTMLYYRHNHHNTDVRAKPPVWTFRPPRPGVYSISGILDEQSTVANSLENISYWIGTAKLDNFGTNPVVRGITTLASGKFTRNDASHELNLRCQLDSTNHCIYMTVWGEVDSGDRRSSIIDDLLITHEQSDTLLILR